MMDHSLKVITNFAKAFLLLSLLAAGLFSCSGTSKTAATSKPSGPLNQEITSLSGEPILLGRVNREGLVKEPYLSWLQQEYNEYKPDVLTLDKIEDEFKEVDLLVFLGTWCEDSQREIPRLYRIIDYLGYKDKNMEMIGVDDHPDRYKKSPNGETERWNVELVPTIILLKEGQELGRIVEFPEDTLERDLQRILENG